MSFPPGRDGCDHWFERLAKGGERRMIPGLKTETGPQMRLAVAIHATTSSPPSLVLSEMGDHSIPG